MKQAFKNRGLAFGTFALTGCTTLTAPMLSHQTGETLGPGHARVYGRFEQARIFPLIASDVTVIGVPQAVDLFRGAVLGVNGELGLLSKIDLQAGAFLSSGGGGWRAAAKYQLLGAGGVTAPGLAVSALLGYRAYSGSGTLTATTVSGTTDLSETLSARTLEFSGPVSYRFSESYAVYSGLTFFRSGVTGQAGTGAVSAVTTDVGVNFGLQLRFGMVQTDAEIAYVRLYDPFMDEVRAVPFGGVSVGLIF